MIINLSVRNGGKYKAVDDSDSFSNTQISNISETEQIIDMVNNTYTSVETTHMPMLLVGN